MSLCHSTRLVQIDASNVARGTLHDATLHCNTLCYIVHLPCSDQCFDLQSTPLLFDSQMAPLSSSRIACNLYILFCCIRLKFMQCTWSLMIIHCGFLSRFDPCVCVWCQSTEATFKQFQEYIAALLWIWKHGRHKRLNSLDKSLQLCVLC